MDSRSVMCAEAIGEWCQGEVVAAIEAQLNALSSFTCLGNAHGTTCGFRHCL